MNVTVPDLSDQGIDEGCIKRLRSLGYVCCAAGDFVNEAINVLRGQGYSITLPAAQYQWEWPREFCDRVGMNVGSLARILRASDLPPVELNWGPNANNGARARLWKIKSNEAFEAWLASRRARCGAAKV